jgi:ketosteroid isomerase-like protein
MLRRAAGDRPRAATVDASSPGAHTPVIPHPPAEETMESERLARRYFALFQAKAFDELADLIHPEAVVVLKSVHPGHVVRGREEVVQFFRDTLAAHLHAIAVDVFRPLDENRVIIEGRVRWMDDEHVLRDDPGIWAVEFRDGLLFLSTPARTAVEAESALVVLRDLASAETPP